MSYKLTAAASRGDRRVYIQAASGGTAQAQRSAVEHAYTAFSDINGALRTDRKLVVLDDDQQQWSRQQVALLAKVAYVGTWSGRDRLVDFVGGAIPESSRVLSGDDQQELAGINT